MIQSLTEYTNLHLTYFTRKGLFFAIYDIAWIYQHIVALQVQLSQFTNCNIWCHIALSVNAVICGI